jgi:hypothetical protein
MAGMQVMRDERQDNTNRMREQQLSHQHAGEGIKKCSKNHKQLNNYSHLIALFARLNALQLPSQGESGVGVEVTLLSSSVC